MNKKQILASLLICLLMACFLYCMLFVTTSSAQTINNGEVSVRINKLQKKGDSLYINMDFTRVGKKIQSHKSVEFVPMIISSDTSKCLPKVSLKGRRNYKAYRRFIALMSKPQKEYYTKQNASYVVIQDNKKNAPRTIQYNIVIPYEKWISAAQFYLVKDDCGCGMKQRTDMRILANRMGVEKKQIIERYTITPHLAYVTPAVQEIKQQSIEQILDFAAGETDLKLNFWRNSSELNKITNVLSAIIKDNNITLNSIELTGYASPEGSFALNQCLSEKRAKALRSYLVELYDYPYTSYKILFGGEDWQGLLELLNDSDMLYKDEVIHLIKTVSIDKGRESKIMTLHAGVPYKYMLNHLFPRLRRVKFRANYSVKKFDIEQAKEIVKTKPQYLSLNEMFYVANTYEKGSSDFTDLFETAVRLYPENQTAILNAAIAALERKDYVTADKYLKKVAANLSIPEYHNALGVLYMMRDSDYNRAEYHFKQAQPVGITEAYRNIEEITKMRKNIDERRAAESED